MKNISSTIFWDPWNNPNYIFLFFISKLKPMLGAERVKRKIFTRKTSSAVQLFTYFDERRSIDSFGLKDECYWQCFGSDHLFAHFPWKALLWKIVMWITAGYWSYFTQASYNFLREKGTCRKFKHSFLDSVLKFKALSWSLLISSKFPSRKQESNYCFWLLHRSWQRIYFKKLVLLGN